MDVNEMDSSAQKVYDDDLSATVRNLQCPLRTDIYDAHTAMVHSSLPTFIHREDAEKTVLEVGSDNLATYIRKDLDVHRLNDIHSHMWACGRPLNARALHRQKMIKRQILATEQADLHLLYYDDRILVKPLPAYLLSPAIWQKHINVDPDLHKDACGFLLSYIWLLRSPLDFQIAKDENLIPIRLEWLRWRTLAHEFLTAVDATSLHQVNKRYQFGELRLDRINSLYRMLPRLAVKHFVRGYLYGYNRYVPFFQRSVKWILVVFIWFSLVLSAMQVGSSLPELQEKQAFMRACLGFVVFSIVLVAALVAFIGALFTVTFVYNMFAAIFHARMQAKRRYKLVGTGKGS